MPTSTVRAVLFLSSYAPLFIIFAFRLWEVNRDAALVMIIVAIASILSLLVFMRKFKEVEPGVEDIKEASSLAGDILSYLFTYLLPFLDFNLHDPWHAASFAVFFLMIAVIYVRSNMIYVNPLLALFGYHIFRVQTAAGKELALITKKRHIAVNSKVLAVRLGDYVLLDPTEKQ